MTIFPVTTNTLSLNTVAQWVLEVKFPKWHKNTLDTPKRFFSHKALQAGLPCHEIQQVRSTTEAAAAAGCGCVSAGAPGVVMLHPTVIMGSTP